MPFRRHASFAVALGLFLSLAVGIRPGVSAAPATTRPNILLIVSDDQTGWTFSPELNPSVYADLVDKGVLFNRAYDVSPECCPSRSEIMTGLYETHTGVDGNRIPLTRPPTTISSSASPSITPRLAVPRIAACIAAA